MPVLIRFAILIGIGLLIYYFVSVRRRRLPSSGGGGEVRIMPYCPKCESNRQVMPNTGQDSFYPIGKIPWYCEGCQEGF